MPFTLCTDEIVLSGIAARLPESANIEEFGKNLLNGVDMVTENRPRWTPGFLGLPPRNGRVLELDKFDGRFFGVHTKQSHAMDPQLRMLFELTFEAIMDAGVNPHELRGSNTGVYIGVSGSETELSFSYHPDLINGYVSPGCHRSMFANRLSYAFDFHGPSFPIDTACSSSMVALEDAVSAIRLGKCDAAIVGGSNLVLHPYTSLHGLKLGMFSPDGKCKSFDISGDGYVKSEGVAVIFIQKKDVARRAYATILNVRNNTDGFKDKGVTFPSGKMQNALLNETYLQAGIDPASLTYFEAHGTGTKAGDPQELNSVVDFSKNRSTPLLIGSVKSNVGHLEPVAGLASIAKMVVAMQAGVIPANLHFNIPNPEIPGLLDGRLKVVSKNTPWEGGIFGINSFGWGGANVHAIFQSGRKNTEVSKLDLEKDLPYLVPFSGRTAEAIEYAFEKLSAMEDQREIVGLLHQIAKQNIVGHEYRGYKILNGSHVPKTQDSNITKKPPVWFVFSGMGSQADVKSLLRIPPFRKSLELSAKILMEKQRYDLMATLTSQDPKIFDNVTNSFLCIVAVQIALVDLLRELGVTPDGIIGHSVGEVSCAYADGCLTQEEAVLLAYWRGQAMLETSCPPGAMAAVGLSWEEANRRCPEGIYPACQNTHDGVTISGTPEGVGEFVKKLKTQGVFAREVATSGFAFHSKYINPAADFLREKLESFLPAQPKERSEKWISTSSNERLCSVDYQINNLVSPVLFANAMDKIPDHSVVIELAPHALLQALLRRALPSNVTRVGLTKKDAPDGLLHLMESLGSLYLAGVDPSFDALYAPVQFPVSVNTPMIHPLIQWDHSTSWDVATFIKPYKSVGETIIDVSITTEEYSFLEDHMIDGRNICPVMMYMYATWKAFAILTEIPLNKLPVEFEAIEFHRPILLAKDKPLRFYVQIFPSTGRFEIEESEALLASGIIRKLTPENREYLKNIPYESTETDSGMTREAIYKEMKLRGYEYKPRFMGVKSQDFNGNWAKIEWQNNWVAFLDSMLHTMILTHRNRDLDLPAGIMKLSIDPIAFQEFYDNNKSVQTEGMPAVSEKHFGSLRLPGVELRGMRTSRGTKRPLHQRLPMLNKFDFEPYLDEETEHKTIDGLSYVLDVVLDNSKTLTVELVEVVDKEEESVVNFLKEIDLFRVEYKLARACFITNFTDEWNEVRTKEGGVIHKVESHEEAFAKINIQEKDVIVVHHEADFPKAAEQIGVEGFVILITKNRMSSQAIAEYPELRLISVKRIPGKFVYLLRKMEILTQLPVYQTITLSNTNYSWVDEVREALKHASVDIDYPKIMLISENEEHSGVVAFVKCLRKEPGGHSLRYLFVKGTEEIRLTNPTPALKKILEDDLVHNVLNEAGVHGFYAHHEYFPDKEVEGPGHSYYLDAGAEGETNFRWHQAPTECWDENCTKTHRKIKTAYSVLNLGELLHATGKIGKNLIKDPENPKVVFAVEFSGVDSNGKRVIGISERSGLATTICTEEQNFVVELPSNISLQDGATLPMAYSTAIYALLVRGNMRKQETVLIHAGFVPVGQAAITLALSMSCTVFTTVRTEAQRIFLKEKFPELADTHILMMDSFEKEILSITKGRGCSTILNTLTEEGLITSIRLIALNGKFLDISRSESPIAMGNFSKNFTYYRIKSDALSDTENPERVLVAMKFTELLNQRIFRPISSKVFEHDEIESAFKFLSSDSNYGKVLLNLTDAETKIKGLRHTYFDSEKVYILAGGLGDTGVEMADWMFAHGARKLVLANRSGVSNTYQAYHIRNWRESGATVEVPSIDITNLEQVRGMFEAARKMGPIGGIFNLSMVLRDNFLEGMTLADFALVANPKILGTRNLDLISREPGMCPELKYFVVFSSITSARGNAGQCNYGFGNSAAEAMVESRLRDGFPACALQFGPIADVGYVEYGMGGSGGSAERVIVGTHPQKIKSVLSALDLLLQNPTGIKTSVVIANRNTSAGVGKISLLEALGNVMGVPDSSKLDLGATLGELGMDSLMAVEMKQMMERDYGLFLSIQEMRTHALGNLVKLAERK